MRTANSPRAKQRSAMRHHDLQCEGAYGTTKVRPQAGVGRSCGARLHGSSSSNWLIGCSATRSRTKRKSASDRPQRPTMPQASAGRARGRSCQQTVMIIVYRSVLFVSVAHMKDRLLIATLAGIGLLVALVIAAVRCDRWKPPAAPVQGPPAHLRLQAAAVPLQAMVVGPVTPTPAANAATQPQPAAPEPAATDPPPDGRQGADSGPAPTYEQEAAARDRAAAHSARSR
jgi:hypothetical protein